MDRIRAARWKFEAVLAGAFAVAATITAIFPQWIEAFGLEPDQGDGTAEWAIVVVLGLVALVSAGFSRRHFLSRPRAPLFGEGSST
jgi:hypothetical protein